MRDVCVLVAQSCPTHCDPRDCNLPDSSVQGILQGRISEWAASLFSRGSTRSRDQTRVFELRANSLRSEPPGKPLRGDRVPANIIGSSRRIGESCTNKAKETIEDWFVCLFVCLGEEDDTE